MSPSPEESGNRKGLLEQQEAQAQGMSETDGSHLICGVGGQRSRLWFPILLGS